MNRKVIASLTWSVLLTIGIQVDTFASSHEAISDYIETYKNIAINEMHDHGVPASIKLAQAIFESNAGRSHLAVYGNNHFGIKCGKYWGGPTVMREDDDYVNGKLIKSCFRAYPDVASSYEAHSQFLLDPKKDFRYGFLFDLDRTDYKAWARGLKKAGYATNPKYPQKLISLIERFGLDAYDHMPRPQGIEEDYIVMRTDHPADDVTIVERESTAVATEQTPNTATLQEQEEPASEATLAYVILHENGIPYVLAHGGEPLDDLVHATGYDIDEVIAANEFTYGRSQGIAEEVRIYLTKKKKRYQGRRNYHRVSKGESVFDIAQRYGIQEKALRKRNRWSDSYEPKAGLRVYLKKKRPRN